MGVKFDGDVWDIYERRAKPTSALPIGTILTLAATGSEMNGSSVITNWETKEKLGHTSRYTYPKFSFCDPENTFTVPKKQREFFVSIDAPTRLSDYNIDDAHLTAMARQNVRFGAVGTFQKLNEADVFEILKSAL